MFQKGHEKKGGRGKGTANKITLTHRELIESIFDLELRSGRIEKALKTIEGKDYLDAIFKLTPFVVPKLNSIDLTQNRPFGGWDNFILGEPDEGVRPLEHTKTV